MATSIPLDDYATEAFHAYVAAVESAHEAEARKAKAKETLINFLDGADATEADIDGRPVLRLIRTDRESLDVDTLRTTEPATWRRYARVTPVTYLRQLGGLR